MADALAALPGVTEKLSPFDYITEQIVKSGAQIFAGVGVAIGSDGNLVHASQAGALFTIGRAEQSVLGDGVQTCRVRSGIFLYNNSGFNALTIANRGSACYWEDDNTVGSLSSTGILAGIVYDVDASGVHVLMGLGVGSETNQSTNKTDSVTFGSLLVNGKINGLHSGSVKTANYTVANVTDGDALLQSATDGVQFTLPASAAANRWQFVKIQNTGAATAVEIQVLLASATDKILGTVMAVSAGGVAGHGMKNTKATTKQGDYLELQSDGAGVWWIVGGMGVWASL